MESYLKLFRRHFFVVTMRVLVFCFRHGSIFCIVFAVKEALIRLYGLTPVLTMFC